MLKNFLFVLQRWETYWTLTHIKAVPVISCMEPVQSEMSILVNGKGHDLGDDMNVPMKTVLEEDP